MTIFFLLALALTPAAGYTSPEQPKDCAIEECSAAELRDLWLDERELRIDWEKEAKGLALELDDARADAAGVRRLYRKAREARLVQAAPLVPEERIGTTCALLIGGAAIAGAAAGAGVTAVAADR